MTVEDRHNLVTANAEGNMKGKKVRSDELFEYFRVPIVVKPNGIDTIYTLAERKAMDISPIRLEKRVNYRDSKQGSLVFRYQPFKVVLEAKVDVEYEERENLLNFIRSSKKASLTKHQARIEREKLRKEVMSSIDLILDDKAEAYAQFGFVDFDFAAGYSFTAMPIYVDKPEGFVNVEVKRIIDTFEDGKEKVYADYLKGIYTWQDVSLYFDPKLSISYRSMNVDGDYDKFYKLDKRVRKARLAVE